MEDFISKLQELMKFISDKYEEDDTFRAYGEYSWPLIEESDIYFGDAAAQLEAIRVLVKEGLMEVVRPSGSTQVRVTTRVRPSLKGLNQVREARKSPFKQHWLKIVSAVTEGVTEGVIKGLMK